MLATLLVNNKKSLKKYEFLCVIADHRATEVRCR